MKNNDAKKVKGKLKLVFLKIMLSFLAAWFKLICTPEIFFTLVKKRIQNQFDIYFSIGLLIAIIGSKSSIKI